MQEWESFYRSTLSSKHLCSILFLKEVAVFIFTNGSGQNPPTRGLTVSPCELYESIDIAKKPARRVGGSILKLLQSVDIRQETRTPPSRGCRIVPNGLSVRCMSWLRSPPCVGFLCSLFSSERAQGVLPRTN